MLRVGLDISPLTLTRAGTARYLANSSTARSRSRARAASVRLGRRRQGDARRARPGWYRFTLPRAVQRDGVQVLHCPTMRAPFRSRVPLVVTIHDAAVLRHPEAHSTAGRARTAPGRCRRSCARRTASSPSPSSRARAVSSSTSPESKIRVIPYGVGPPFTAEGPRCRRRLRSRRLDARAAQEPAPAGRGFRRAGLDGLELRVVGAAGWGGVSVDGDRVRRLAGSTTRSSRASTAARGRRLRVALRGLRPARARGDGLRRAGRRRRAGAPSASSPTVPRSGRPARPGLDRRRPTPRRSPQGMWRSARSGRPTTAGSAPSSATLDRLPRAAG